MYAGILSSAHVLHGFALSVWGQTISDSLDDHIAVKIAIICCCCAYVLECALSPAVLAVRPAIKVAQHAIIAAHQYQLDPIYIPHLFLGKAEAHVETSVSFFAGPSTVALSPSEYFLQVFHAALVGNGWCCELYAAFISILWAQATIWFKVPSVHPLVLVWTVDSFYTVSILVQHIAELIDEHVLEIFSSQASFFAAISIVFIFSPVGPV